VGKAARIRRERAAKAQAAPAEDEQLLSVFDIADLDGLERHWERRFDLAPLRRSELAPPPSDWLLTVRGS
jgi:hypothetical protein